MTKAKQKIDGVHVMLQGVSDIDDLIVTLDMPTCLLTAKYDIYVKEWFLKWVHTFMWLVFLPQWW